MGTIATHIHPNTKEFIAGIQKALIKMAGGLEAEGRFMQPLTAEDIIADMDANGIERIPPEVSFCSHMIEWVGSLPCWGLNVAVAAPAPEDSDLLPG